MNKMSIFKADNGIDILEEFRKKYIEMYFSDERFNSNLMERYEKQCLANGVRVVDMRFVTIKDNKVYITTGLQGEPFNQSFCTCWFTVENNLVKFSDDIEEHYYTDLESLVDIITDVWSKFASSWYKESIEKEVIKESEEVKVETSHTDLGFEVSFVVDKSKETLVFSGNSMDNLICYIKNFPGDYEDKTHIKLGAGMLFGEILLSYHKTLYIIYKDFSSTVIKYKDKHSVIMDILGYEIRITASTLIRDIGSEYIDLDRIGLSLGVSKKNKLESEE